MINHTIWKVYQAFTTLYLASYIIYDNHTFAKVTNFHNLMIIIHFDKYETFTTFYFDCVSNNILLQTHILKSGKHSTL